MNYIIKKILIILALFFCVSWQQKSIQIVRALNSPFGHTVYVGELDDNGEKTTHLSLSFANKKCILGVLKFHGAHERIKLSWKKDNELNIHLPTRVEFFSEFPLGFLECESQRVDVTLFITSNDLFEN